MHQLSLPSTNASISHGFQDWLASVTERINLSMHYGVNPDPLTWLVPQFFFDALMDRISNGTQKKRLPNTTHTINRPPRGQFVKYTWHITNILQLKKVFDTPLVQLEISRKFRQNSDGSYTYKTNTPLNDELCSNSKRHRPCKNLRPLEEFRTFLKVGQMSSDPRDITPFKIEWVPDILPRTRTGELMVNFQFGHQVNGQLDLSMSKKDAIVL